MKKSKEQISYNMKRVKNKDSKIELLLRAELWRRGLRYRKNVSHMMGKPDIAFISKKLVVFCDSEFWHGYDWETKQSEIKSNRDFWIRKIEGNMRRDQEVNGFYKEEGWTVIRFWGNEIKKDPKRCADIVEKALEVKQ